MSTVHILLSGEHRNPIGSVARLDDCIVVGFGYAHVYVDFADGLGERTVFDGEIEYRRRERPLTFRDVERKVRRDPRGVWRCRMYAPLWDATWERKRPGKWVCIEAGEGFA